MKPIKHNSRHYKKLKILENKVKPLFTDGMTEVLTLREAGLSTDDLTLPISLFTSVPLSSGSFRERWASAAGAPWPWASPPHWRSLEMIPGQLKKKVWPPDFEETLQIPNIFDIQRDPYKWKSTEKTIDHTLWVRTQGKHHVFLVPQSSVCWREAGVEMKSYTTEQGKWTGESHRVPHSTVLPPSKAGGCITFPSPLMKDRTGPKH